MAGAHGVAAKVFHALGSAGVNVRAIAQGASERNISVVIDGKGSARALRSVHSSFYLSAHTVSIGLIGPGLVGSSLLEQVGYWPVGASIHDSLWTAAIHVMLKNLELLDVLEREGNVLRLTDGHQSRIKAHPGHLQNRGEKPYRIRLSQFLAALQGGRP